MTHLPWMPRPIPSRFQKGCPPPPKLRPPWKCKTLHALPTDPLLLPTWGKGRVERPPDLCHGKEPMMLRTQQQRWPESWPHHQKPHLSRRWLNVPWCQSWMELVRAKEVPYLTLPLFTFTVNRLEGTRSLLQSSRPFHPHPLPHRLRMKRIPQLLVSK